jgi:hypothetical protein
MRALAAMTVALWALAAQAQTVYRCQDGRGQTVFQESPCHDGKGRAVDASPANVVQGDRRAQARLLRDAEVRRAIETGRPHAGHDGN